MVIQDLIPYTYEYEPFCDDPARLDYWIFRAYLATSIKRLVTTCENFSKCNFSNGDKLKFVEAYLPTARNLAKFEKLNEYNTLTQLKKISMTKAHRL